MAERDRSSSNTSAPIGEVRPPPPSREYPADFSGFYRSFVPTLVAFLIWQGARLSDAADIAQDTMMKAYERWPTLQHPKAWARTVSARALARRIASIEEVPRDDLAEHIVLLPSSVTIETWEQRHEVLRMLELLSPRQRQVMAWTLDGYTPTEIATELQITADAVRANLLKARRALATYLNHEAGKDDG